MCSTYVHTHLDFSIPAEEARIMINQACQLCSIKKEYQKKKLLQNKLGKRLAIACEKDEIQQKLKYV